MEFPLGEEEWSVFTAEDFDSAEVRDPRHLGLEVLAQARPNGRIQDHFRIVLGGGKPLNFSSLYSGSKYDAYKLRFQYWPRDIAIRRNSTTSNWKGVYDLLAERNAAVVDMEGGTVPTDQVLDVMREEMPKGEAASIRWGIVIGDDKKLRLDLTVLPASEATINGRPILKR